MYLLKQLSKNVWLLVACLALAGAAMAQEYTQIQDVDVLKQQKEVFIHKYPDMFETAIISAIYESPKGFAKVVYEMDGLVQDVIINTGREDMMMLEKATLIPDEKIPAPVLKAMKDSKYGNWTLDNGFEVERPDTGMLYRLEISNVMADGTKKTKSIYFDGLGHPAKAPF